MKKYLLPILLLIMFIPFYANAEEFTFKICNDCEWNFDNLNELNSHIESINNRDYDDDILENKYIIEFADGNYTFDYNFPMFETNNTELYFGEGTYTFDQLSIEGIRYVIKGKGIGKTIINANDLSSEDNFIIGISDMTIKINDYFNLDTSGENFNDYYGITYILDEEKAGIKLENVDIRYNGENSPEVFINCFQYMPSLTINNIKYVGKEILFEFENDGDLENEQFDYINIINSDFSKTNLTFEVDGKANRINIENSKLNKIYAGYGITVQIDCNSTFVNGTSRGKGELQSDEALNQYNIYEYQNELYSEYNGQIITSVCKKKEIKITDRVKLEDLNKELRLEIDGTWIAKPEGIIQINNNELIPLKIGKTILSKEIDGIINNVTIDVIEDNTISVPDTIKNPNTGTGMYVVISIIILAITLSLYLVMKKKKNDIIK